MAFDAHATQQLINNPADFLANNYVKVVWGHQLTVTRSGKLGAQWNNPSKLYSTQYALNSNQMLITNADLVTVTSIAGRPKPTVFFGLDRLGDNEFEAQVTDNQDNQHPAEALMCPFKANKITGIKLPNNNGPSLCLTDAISGCSVFVTHENNHDWFFHANAASVLAGNNDDGRIYMRNLYRAYTNGTAHNITHYFDRPFYEADTNDWIDDWKEQKRGVVLGMRRDIDQMHAYQRNVSVFGVRDPNTGWSYHWQKAMTLESKRTGLERVIKGRDSSKFKLAFEPIPAVNAIPNP